MSRFIPLPLGSIIKGDQPPLILTQHSQALRYSYLGDQSLLPQLLSAIPIASAASTVLTRAGLRNLCNAEILLEIAGQSGFWGASWRGCSLPDRLLRLLTGGRMNVYVLDFLVAERLRPLLPGGRTCVPQVNIKIVSTTSRRPFALQRLSSATSNSPDRHNVQSWERRTRCLRH